MKRTIKVEGHGEVEFKSNAQMVLWPASDYPIISNHYLKCCQLTHDVQFHSKMTLNAYRDYTETFNLSKDSAEIAYYKNRYEKIKNETEELRIDLDRLIDELESGVYNYKHSDKKNGFQLGDGKVEPQTICIKENTLVNPALVIYAKQIANFGIEEFRYIASGTGSLPTTPNQNKLQAENSRLDIFINGGFRNPNGDVVREGVIFPPGLDDALIKEFGSFTMPTADEGDMQWRNVIDNPAEQIDHDQGNTFYSIAHVTILQINYIND